MWLPLHRCIKPWFLVLRGEIGRFKSNTSISLAKTIASNCFLIWICLKEASTKGSAAKLVLLFFCYFCRVENHPGSLEMLILNGLVWRKFLWDTLKLTMDQFSLTGDFPWLSRKFQVQFPQVYISHENFTGGISYQCGGFFNRPYRPWLDFHPMVWFPTDVLYFVKLLDCGKRWDMEDRI